MTATQDIEKAIASVGGQYNQVGFVFLRRVDYAFDNFPASQFFLARPGLLGTI